MAYGKKASTRPKKRNVKKTRATKNSGGKKAKGGRGSKPHLVAKGKGKISSRSKKSLGGIVRRNRKTRKSSFTGSSWNKGTGKNKNQITFWFPSNAKETDKVKILKRWDGAPLDYYIRKNRVVKRKGKYVYSATGFDVLIPGTTSGFRPPQSVWIKLVKRKPRNKELFYSAILSPPDFVVNKRNTLAFAVGVMEKYYSDFVAAVKDNNLVKERNPKTKYRLVGSDPDDYEGKPMKIVAIIFHFLY